MILMNSNLYFRDSKVKMAFWFADSCYTDNFRESYVYALKKYFEIDDYGEW